jgi:hypothetical protein
MRRTTSGRAVALLTSAAASLLLLTACGSTASKSDDASSSPHAAPKADTSLGEGDWLLGVSTAGGADGEKTTITYLTYNPSTGETRTRSLPGVTTASASPREAALLVSAERRWAIPDTSISREEQRSGKLRVYSLTGTSSVVVDVRARTRIPDLRPVAWAFSPDQPATLRVVDTKNRVWTMGVLGTGAERTGALTKGPWVFTDGFDPNSAEPYVESISSEQTRPAGNGATDTRAVTRDGGTILTVDSPQLKGSPCRLPAGFADAQGTTWVFCAEKPTLTTYYRSGDQDWKAYGKPSAAVSPEAADFSLVLPPVSS